MRVVVYDGECGFCQRSIRWIAGHTTARDIQFIPFQERDPAGLHHQLTIEECRQGVQLIESGRRYSGFDAFRKLLPYLPIVKWLVPLAYLPGASLVGAWGYRLIARNRYRLGGPAPR